MTSGPESIAAARPMRATRLPILVAAVTIGAGVGLIFPLLAEIQDEFGFSTASLGLISASAFGSAVVSGLLLAGLADRGHGRRLLVVGLAASAASLFWFALGTELWHFVAARSCEGLAAGVYFPAARKFMASGDPLTAGRSLGRLTSAEVGGLLLGPVVGASLTAWLGLDAPFVAVGTVALVLSGCMAVVPLPVVPVTLGRQSMLRGFRMLRRRRIAGAALLSLALFLPVGIYDSLWSRYLTDRGASTLFIGVSLTMYAVPVIALAGRGGRLADRLGPVRTATLALYLIIPMTMVYGLLPWPVAIALVAFVEGVPQAMATPAVQLAMVQACESDELAAGQGVATSMNQIGAALAALVGPLVYEQFGSATVFIGVSLVMGVVFAIGVRLSSPGPQPSGSTLRLHLSS